MAASDQKKAAALRALMESDTLTEAAEKANISRKTLYNYMRSDMDFASTYKAMQEQAAVETAEAMKGNRARAEAVILAIMDDQNQPGAVRLKAAQAIMEETRKATETSKGIIAQHVSSLGWKDFGL